jgi:hypothetical protein
VESLLLIVTTQVGHTATIAFAPTTFFNVDEGINNSFTTPFLTQAGAVVLCDQGTLPPMDGTGPSCVDDGGETKGVSDIIVWLGGGGFVSLLSDGPIPFTELNPPPGDVPHLVPPPSAVDFPVIFLDERIPGQPGENVGETIPYDPLIGGPGYVGNGSAASSVGYTIRSDGPDLPPNVGVLAPEPSSLVLTGLLLAFVAAARYRLRLWPLH